VPRCGGERLGGAWGVVFSLLIFPVFEAAIGRGSGYLAGIKLGAL
jgi:hypothetical protein